MYLIHPSTILVSGPTGSGKTKFVSDLIAHQIIQPSPERICWVYSEWQPLYEELSLQYSELVFIKGIPPNLLESFSSSRRNLIVLDDQMSDTGSSKELANLFTKESHHRNISVIYIVQNLFDKGKSMRTVSLNTQYLILFKNPRDKGQIGQLSRQMYPNNPTFLVHCFNDATEKRYGYLFLDLRPETEEDSRVKTDIFASDTTIIYQPLRYKMEYLRETRNFLNAS